MVINQLSVPSVKVAAVYNTTLTQTGGTPAIAWTVVAGKLPNWLTLNPVTGNLGGTANRAGVYNFTVQAVDSSATPLVATQSFTIVSGTTSIADVATWVTSDYLKRSDITTEAQNAAIMVYRLLTLKVPFEQLYNLTPELPLSQGVDNYDLSELVPPLAGIVDIRMTVNQTQRRRWRRSSSRLYDSLSIINNGQPSTYARTSAQQIQINPPPDTGTYTMRIRYWSRAPEDSTTANTVLATPIEWDALFKWETAWWVLNEIGQETRASQLVQPMMMPRQASPKKQKMLEIGIIPRLWNELLTTISEKENVDEDFSVNPVMRAYSWRGR